MYFAVRTTHPQALQQAKVRYDTHLLQYLRQLIIGDGVGFCFLKQRIAILPIKHGGLGVYTMYDIIHYCYLASQLQTFNLQRTILISTIVPEKIFISQQVLHDYL